MKETDNILSLYFSSKADLIILIEITFNMPSITLANKRIKGINEYRCIALVSKNLQMDRWGVLLDMRGRILVGSWWMCDLLHLEIQWNHSSLCQILNTTIKLLMVRELIADEIIKRELHDHRCCWLRMSLQL
jgi:hypothetical protein